MSGDKGLAKTMRVRGYGYGYLSGSVVPLPQKERDEVLLLRVSRKIV